MEAQKVGVFVTGTINSHFFVTGQTVTFFARVSSVTDRYETRAKNVNRCPLLVIAIPEIPISGFPEIPFSPKSRNSGIFQAKIPEIRDFHFLHYLL